MQENISQREQTKLFFKQKDQSKAKQNKTKQTKNMVKPHSQPQKGP